MNSPKTAAALSYPENAEAPLISAKGKGPAAEAILRLADEHGIPVCTDENTAHILTLYDTGSTVPPETYEVLAGIFAFIRRTYGQTATH